MTKSYVYPDELSDAYVQQRSHFTATESEVLQEVGKINLRGAQVLDHGCGDGRYSEWFFARGASEVVGIDNSKRMIERARARANRARYVLGDAVELPFYDATFNLVFSNFTLHHIADLRAALCEMYRVLVPDGRVVATLGAFHIPAGVSVPSGQFGPVRLSGRGAVVCMQTVVRSVQTVRSAFVEAGFKLEEFREIENKNATIDATHPHSGSIILTTILVVAQK